MANWYHWREQSLFLHIQLQPRASCDEIIGPHGDYLKIRITSPPLDNRANQHLIQFLAAIFDVPKKNITIEYGETSRIKTIKIVSPKNIGILDENCFRK